MNKKWVCKEIDENQVNDLVKKYKINEVLARILINKGITSKEDIELFMNPTRNDFHDPFLMPDMEIAVQRVIKAIEDNQKIMIYGDYDADGITSTTVLKSFLKERGLQVDSYIPNRLDEGYGLNKEAIKKIFENEKRKHNGGGGVCIQPDTSGDPVDLKDCHRTLPGDSGYGADR